MLLTKVLLIDDDENYLTLTRRMLAHTGHQYQVDQALTYDDGLRAMCDEDYDIVLLDYHLDEANGLDLLAEAFEKGVKTPIIMMTSQGEYSVDTQSLQVGAADYVDKIELKPDVLHRAIRYALERTKVMQQLRDSEERYRNLIDEAFEGIAIADTSGKINYANQRLADLTGYSIDELIGMTTHALGITDIADLKENGTGRLLEQTLKRKNSSTFYAEISAKRVSGGRIHLIMRDVSQRQDTLRERDQYIEQLTILGQIDEELSHILNIDYVLNLALDAAVRLGGADSGFIGLHDNGEIEVAITLGAYSNIKQDVAKTPLIARLLDDETPRLIQDVADEPDYIAVSEKTEAVMLLPMMSYERIVGVINLETSHTDRFTPEAFEFLKLIAARVAVAVENAQLYRIAQDQLAQLQELYAQVSELEQIKTDMIRIAAHDLRNPVSVIVGYAQLMEASMDAEAREKYGRFISQIERSANRMEKITTDILSLEKIENIQSDPGQILNFNELVIETFGDFKSQADEKSQPFTLDTPDGAPIQVQGDPAQLREAVANLISNAIKYTPDKGQINVKLEHVDDKAVFKVEDHGYGIPLEQQNSLFQPFFRAHSAETEDIEGTGLGLYLIKNIIERYNGSMIFKSVYGEGSTFGFQLPIAE